MSMMNRLVTSTLMFVVFYLFIAFKFLPNSVLCFKALSIFIIKYLLVIKYFLVFYSGKKLYNLLFNDYFGFNFNII